MRIFSAVVSAVLGACILAQIVAGKPSVGFIIVTFIAAGFLWVPLLWPAMPAGLRVTSIVLACILSLVSAIGGMVGVGNGLAARFDIPNAAAPVIMGGADSLHTAAIVYHPGGSAFPKRVVTALGEKLAARGCRVVVMTAHPALGFEEKAFGALVLCSPVYGGVIRPPLQEFVAAHAPFSIPVYAIVTGGMPGVEGINLRMVSETLEKSDLHPIDTIRIVNKEKRDAIEAKIALIADSVMETLDKKAE
jgi:hypothetical protein